MKPPLHNESLVNEETHIKKIGKEFAEKRAPHLTQLAAPLELAQKICPLPMSYDVTRLQHPYFNEFSYTEFLGCLYISPQSAEIAARMIEAADIDQRHSFGFMTYKEILNRKQADGTLDKYTLEADAELNPDAKKIAFVPGDNIFTTAISKELLARFMDDPEAYIKPHPMTTPNLTRMLGREFGYHRILEPMHSGWKYLQQATEVHVSTTTEMGIYAAMLGKPIHNIGNYFLEARGCYVPFYRLLWNKNIAQNEMTIKRVLASPLSGVFHPEDPDLEEKMFIFFDSCMKLREFFKPRVQEIGISEWIDIQASKMNANKPKDSNGPVRKGR